MLDVRSLMLYVSGSLTVLTNPTEFDQVGLDLVIAFFHDLRENCCFATQSHIVNIATALTQKMMMVSTVIDFVSSDVV